MDIQKTGENKKGGAASGSAFYSAKKLRQGHKHARFCGNRYDGCFSACKSIPRHKRIAGIIISRKSIAAEHSCHAEVSHPSACLAFILVQRKQAVKQIFLRLPLDLPKFLIWSRVKNKGINVK
jgi:hypothetical protein